MAEVFNVSKRSEAGRQANKRLRRNGGVPAVLYGHGEESLSLTIQKEEVASALRRSDKVVNLRGDVTDSALIRAVQWDAFGIEVLHVDLMRVSESETVDITLTLELRGEAAGARDGGVVNFVLHEIELTCPVTAIPQHLYVNVSKLGLGDAIHAGELELPSGATLLTDPQAVIVNCTAAPTTEEAVPGGVVAEPELIRKAKDEDEEE